MSKNNPQYVIVHTAAFKGDASVNDVRRWHKEKGWSDIGYHYYIRRDGTVHKGRDESVKGAHCVDMGMNSKSIGICFEGHGDFQPWTLGQRSGFVMLADYILDKYNIPIANVLGHREAGAKKTCPGNLIDMDAVRDLLDRSLLPFSCEDE